MARQIARCGFVISLMMASGAPVSADDGPSAAITAVPYTVSKPGRYFLAADLTYKPSDGAAIIINADDVSLDLQGHTLQGSAGTASSAVGVLATDRMRVAITNGTVSGFYFGIDLRSDDRLGASSTGHELSNLTVHGNWYFGIRLVGSDSKIENCRVTFTGGCSRKGHTIPHGIRLAGPRNILRNSCVRDLRLSRSADGRGEIVGIHFDAAPGSRMEGNTIAELSNEFDDSFEDDERERRFGVWINGGPNKDTFLTVKNSRFSGFTVPLAFTPGTDGTVEGNTFAGASPAPIRGRAAAQLAENTVVEQPQDVDCPLAD